MTQCPDQPPELWHTKPHALASVAQVWLSQRWFPLYDCPLLQVQSCALQSEPCTQGSPGLPAGGGAASGVPMLLPVHPPWLLHADGQILPNAMHAPWVHCATVIGRCPSVQSQIAGAQSALVVQPAHPPSLTHAAGHTFSGAQEQ
jgi:hypothetical protein